MDRVYHRWYVASPVGRACRILAVAYSDDDASGSSDGEQHHSRAHCHRLFAIKNGELEYVLSRLSYSNFSKQRHAHQPQNDQTPVSSAGLADPGFFFSTSYLLTMGYP